MHVISHTLKLPIWQRLSTKTLFFLLSIILIFLFSMYAYLVNRTIMNVVARSHTEQSIAQVSTNLGDLEAKYLTLQDSVTIDLAHEKGFKDANPTFIARSGNIAYNTAR